MDPIVGGLPIAFFLFCCRPSVLRSSKQGLFQRPSSITWIPKVFQIIAQSLLTISDSYCFPYFWIEMAIPHYLTPAGTHLEASLLGHLTLCCRCDEALIFQSLELGSLGDSC